MEKKSKREEMFNRMVNRNTKHRGEFMGFQESMEDVLDFIEQELDRAREDGIREALEEINRTLGTNIKYINGEYRVVFRRVSKLKDNK